MKTINTYFNIYKHTPGYTGSLQNYLVMSIVPEPNTNFEIIQIELQNRFPAAEGWQIELNQHKEYHVTKVYN